MKPNRLGWFSDAAEPEIKRRSSRAGRGGTEVTQDKLIFGDRVVDIEQIRPIPTREGKGAKLVLVDETGHHAAGMMAVAQEHKILINDISARQGKGEQ